MLVGSVRAGTEAIIHAELQLLLTPPHSQVLPSRFYPSFGPKHSAFLPGLKKHNPTNEGLASKSSSLNQTLFLYVKLSICNLIS